MEPSEHPAKKIRFLLYTHSMTHEQLAHELGVTTESLREIVDELCLPSPSLLHRICNYFGVNDTYFASTSVHPAAPLSGPAAPDHGLPSPGSTTVLITPQGRRTTGATSSPARGVTAQRASAAPRAAGAARAPSAPRAAGQVSPAARKRRKVDLAELVARHQALLECLVAKRVVGASEYQKRLDVMRAKLLVRQKGP